MDKIWVVPIQGRDRAVGTQRFVRKSRKTDLSGRDYPSSKNQTNQFVPFECLLADSQKISL